MDEYRAGLLCLFRPSRPPLGNEDYELGWFYFGGPTRSYSSLAPRHAGRHCYMRKLVVFQIVLKVGAAARANVSTVVHV